MLRRHTALRILTFAAVGALAVYAATHSPKHLTAIERLQEPHLEALHQQRIKWDRERVVEPPPGIYHDYRAVLHVHAEDAKHTLGTREQVLTAAREAGVKVVMWTDHRGPKADTWHGVRQGVLFIPGSEDDDHKLRYPESNGALQFLSHIEEVPDKSAEGFEGMEIYNRHADAKANAELTEYLKSTMENKREFSRLASKLKRYPDEVFAAGTGYLADYLTRYDREIATRSFTGIAANDAHRNTVLNNVVFDPYEVSFHNVSTHILARDFTEDQIRASLREGHAYVAHDWLCDPTGFAFVASNNYGLFEMGDQVPMQNGTRLTARFPIEAHIKIFHKGKIVHEATSKQLTYKPEEEGAYRLEAWLTADGEDRPWIYSNPIYLNKYPRALELPPPSLAPNVKVIKDVVYTEGKPEDATKHKLDLYLPTDKSNFPVLFFVHGGSWKTGDRSQYPGLANRFAKQGIGVVVPSYRLAPKNAPPAQIEDVAAAFAWTVRHIAEHGGDAGKIFIGGHSAGGHLVSELALDAKWLAKHDLTSKSIKGVAALSGVYDVGSIDTFGANPAERNQYSPMQFVNRGAPPFLITYCEHDYASLPAQARAFDAALRRAFVPATLLFIPGENHISEIVSVWKDDDPTARAVLALIAGQP